MAFDLGGIIAGGIGGGAQAVQSMAQDQIATANKADLFRQEQEAELNKLNAAETFRTQLANQQRVTSSGLINARAKELADAQQATDLNNFYNKSDASGPASPAVSALTPADLSDEERAMVPVNDRDMQSHRVRAAAELGYTPPTIDAQTNANMARYEGMAQAHMYGSDRNAESRQGVADTNARSKSDVQDKKDATWLAVTQKKVDALPTGEHAVHDQLVTMTGTENALQKDIDSLRQSPAAVMGSAAEKAQNAQDIADAKAKQDAIRVRKDALMAAHPAAAATALAITNGPPGGENLSQTGASSIKAPTTLAPAKTGIRPDAASAAAAYQASLTGQ